jgi:hypothetical protein
MKIGSEGSAAYFRINLMNYPAASCWELTLKEINKNNARPD